ncbi:MAG: hypothetical protein CMJ25_16895 [Phycisphaerae bacterium]|nr:hypothetical protein [Phycisphaerae bacterium]
MAMYNYGLDSFTHVEHLYNNTKPIRGTNIVPIGDRRRKWECIIKVSPHQYVLSDYGEHQLSHTAAVVWTRNADGTDTVQFRNETGDYAHNGRYSFLERCMPLGMRFVVDSGKQYIHYVTSRYYLPKSADKPVVFTSQTLPLEPDAGHRHNGAWTLTSDPHPVPVIRVRVNKEAKAPYKKAIDEYLHWAWAMTPLLEGTMDWESNREATRGANAVKGNTFRDMLMDDQHEQRTTMVHAFLCELADSMGNRYWSGFSDKNVSLTSDPKKFRTKFNTWINYYGEFNDSFEEYREVK